MADPRRAVRVAEAVRQEVASFLAERAKDPRLVGMVTVTGVDVTRDLRHATVFVSIMGEPDERAATLEGLDSLSGHLRTHLGRVLRLRVAPELVFRLDQSIARAARIHALLNDLNRDRRATDEPSVDEPDAGHDRG
jgi:ribosome-binding factor A